ncbi:MAG: CRISPR-associated protein Cas4 [Opitutales bacterium]
MSALPTPSVPLSALQHYLYCPRQCALIHVERAWAENRFTAQGRVLHEKVHENDAETRPGVRTLRGLEVDAPALGLHGVCDVVELHADGQMVPVEFKHGRPKAHRADEVQLCAQGLCLEASFNKASGTLDHGFLYYGKPRRRTRVAFDSTLRRLTLDCAARIRALLHSATTPYADYNRRRCDRCSLIEHCQPKALRLKRGVATWFQSQALASHIEPTSTGGLDD